MNKVSEDAQGRLIPRLRRAARSSMFDFDAGKLRDHRHHRAGLHPVRRTCRASCGSSDSSISKMRRMASRVPRAVHGGDARGRHVAEHAQADGGEARGGHEGQPRLFTPCARSRRRRSSAAIESKPGLGAADRQPPSALPPPQGTSRPSVPSRRPNLSTRTTLEGDLVRGFRDRPSSPRTGTTRNVSPRWKRRRRPTGRKRSTRLRAAPDDKPAIHLLRLASNARGDAPQALFRPRGGRRCSMTDADIEASKAPLMDHLDRVALAPHQGASRPSSWYSCSATYFAKDLYNLLVHPLPAGRRDRRRG